MKTIKNTSDKTITFNRKRIAPSQFGELPDGVADKYIQRNRCVEVQTENRPVRTTPKRKPRSDPAPEDLV